MQQTSQAVLDLGTRQHQLTIVRCMLVELQHLGMVGNVCTEPDGSQRNGNAHTSVVVLTCVNRSAQIVELCAIITCNTSKDYASSVCKLREAITLLTLKKKKNC